MAKGECELRADALMASITLEDGEGSYYFVPNHRSIVATALRDVARECAEIVKERMLLANKYAGRESDMLCEAAQLIRERFGIEEESR